MKVIKLHNRYGEDNSLVLTEEGKYMLYLDPISHSRLRVLYKSGSEEIIAVDPSGGPYIGIGYVIEEVGKYVKSIERDDSRNFILVTDDICSNQQ